jgi:CRP/FNR family cyclic AMP-dependent transcriptional regulator
MARLSERAAALEHMWLFSGCSARELNRLARAVDDATVEPGYVLCTEGDIGQEVFLIRSGQAVVRRKGRKVATLGAGEHVGELALLDRQPRSATVVAETPLQLFVMTTKDFIQALEETPSIARKLLATLAGRLREADSKLYG